MREVSLSLCHVLAELIAAQDTPAADKLLSQARQRANSLLRLSHASIKALVRLY